MAEAGQPFNAPYCGSKGALGTLTRNTAFAVMRNRIRVNQLNIGWMASDGEDKIQREFHKASPNWVEQAAAQQPFGRLLAPEEVARAVNFYVSIFKNSKVVGVSRYGDAGPGPRPRLCTHPSLRPRA